MRFQEGMRFQDLKILKYGLLALIIAIHITRMLIPTSFDTNPAHPNKDPQKTMAAIVYETHGDHTVLQWKDDHPIPKPRKNQVLVKVLASSLNPVDFKMRRSRFVPRFLIPLPKIPGCDIAGVIEDPRKSTKYKKGDRVAAMLPLMGTRWGANADYVAVDESLLARIGDNTDFEAAAAYPLVGLTVIQDFRSLEYVNNRQETQTKKVLIHAGAGGVGTFAIQYAKKVLGMYVATTASKPKGTLLKELGADLVIDYRSENFEDIATDYDVVLDPMSWLYEERTFQSNVLKSGGHYLNVPSSDWSFDGQERSTGWPSVKNLVISKIRNFLSPGSTPRYSMVFVQPSGGDLQLILNLIDSGTIEPIIDKKFHLSDAQKAYVYLEQGVSTGKVMLFHGDRTGDQQEAGTEPVEANDTTESEIAERKQENIKELSPSIEAME